MFEEQGYPPSPAHRAAYRGATHHGAEGPLVRLRQVLVPSDIDANVRLGQAEVRATCLARLHLPLRASALSSRRRASWVAMPWDASTSMGGGGGRGASAARGAPAPRAGEVALGGSPGAGPGSRPSAKAGSAAASFASGGASRGGHWSHGLGRPKRQASHQSCVCSPGGLLPFGELRSRHLLRPGGQGAGRWALGVHHRGRRGVRESRPRVYRMDTSVQEVLGHVHSRGLGGPGLGGPCPGVRGRWLMKAAPSVGVAGLPGSCRYAPADTGGHPLLCR